RMAGFPSRLILDVADPSDPAFVSFLKSRDYVTNTEQLRWDRLRTVVEVVIAATGLLALILMGISALVFVLFMELTVARARPDLQLLLQLGYQPAWLRGFMSRRFMPMMLGAVLVAILLAGGAQLVASIGL